MDQELGLQQKFKEGSMYQELEEWMISKMKIVSFTPDYPSTRCSCNAIGIVLLTYSWFLLPLFENIGRA